MAVPQGTVLGPVLFLVYINDLSTNIKNCTVSSFADDTRIKKKISNENDVTTLQEAVIDATTWSNDNNMRLHEHKFELLLHASRKKPTSDLPFSNQFFEYETVSGQTIYDTPMVRDLGINLTPELSWSPHINIICDSARQMSSWVLSVFSDRTETTMLTLYKTMIRNTLEYCSPLWCPSKISDIQSLEGIQRHFTSRISGYSDMSYWERLHGLDLMSLQRRRERYIIILMFKLLNNMMPNDLYVKFTHSDRRGIRAIVPPLTKTASAKAQSKYDESFAVLGPKLWNCIPSDTTKITKLVTFKTSLGKYLKQIPDQPPTLGYTAVNNNSLLQHSVRGRPLGRRR